MVQHLSGVNSISLAHIIFNSRPVWYDKHYNALPDTRSTDTFSWKISLIQWPLGCYSSLSIAVPNLPIISFTGPKRLRDKVGVTMAKIHYFTPQCTSYIKSIGKGQAHCKIVPFKSTTSPWTLVMPGWNDMRSAIFSKKNIKRDLKWRPSWWISHSGRGDWGCQDHY